MAPDPSLPGNFSGPKPPVVMVMPSNQLVQYTDPNQFEFFKAWINWTWNNNCNVRFWVNDGTTIQWYTRYFLPLGHYLWQGEKVLTEQDVRYFLSPSTQWPDDLGPLFHPQPDTDTGLA